MEQTAYVGTYTSAGGKGICRIGFREGRLFLRGEWPAVNPSFLLRRGDTLYAVCETPDGSAASYRIGQDGELALTGVQKAGGDAPCHLCLDGDVLYVSNYGSGSLSAFALDGGRAISRPPRLIVRPPASRVHFACVTPDGAFLAVCDLGLDAVLFYPRAGGGVAEAAETVCVPSGSGPRHAAFGRAGVWYVVCELTCELLVYRGYGKEARLAQCFPMSFGQDQEAFSAALRMSPDGKLLLSSVRGADVLVVHDILENGLLGESRAFGAHGAWPRDAAFTPCGRYVLAACERGDCLAAFSLSRGVLAFAGSLAMPSPACVCF